MFFFFKQKTAYEMRISDWSSDVCSSDLLVIIPVSTALAMLDTNTLFRILVEARNRDYLEEVKAGSLKMIMQRHEGEEDVTILTQDAVLETFDKKIGSASCRERVCQYV